MDKWSNGGKCYYAHHQTASGLVLDVDDVNGYGSENITSDSVIPGDYLVQVNYYSDHDSENVIGTNYVVVIRQGEQSSLNYYSYLSDSRDLWNVTTLHFDSVKGWNVKSDDTYCKVNPAAFYQIKLMNIEKTGVNNAPVFSL